jgi:hypothetical protein
MKRIAKMRVAGATVLLASLLTVAGAGAVAASTARAA